MNNYSSFCPLNNTKLRARKIAHSHYPATRDPMFMGCAPTHATLTPWAHPGLQNHGCEKLRVTREIKNSILLRGLLCEAADSQSERPALERKIEN